MADTEIDNCYSDLCASYQKAAFDQLVKTTEKVLGEEVQIIWIIRWSFQ